MADFEEDISAAFQALEATWWRLRAHGRGQ